MKPHLVRPAAWILALSAGVVAAAPAHAQTAAQIASAASYVESAAKSDYSLVVKTALSLGTTIPAFIIANQVAIEADAVKGGCDVANFAVGKLFAAAVGGFVPTPFNVCGATASGAGYYLMGQYGPGGAVPFNKFTAFLPVKALGCTVREYNFTFSITGPNNLMGYASAGASAVARANAMFAGKSQLDVFMQQQLKGPTQMANYFKAFYNLVGDFAVMAAFNPYTSASYLYVMASDTTRLGKGIAAGSPGITAYNNLVAESTLLMQAMNGGSDNLPKATTVLTGNNIQDHFALNCNYPLVFWYIGGTGMLYLN